VTVGLCELVPVVVILINWLAPVVLGLELEVPLRHALSLLSSLKNSDAFTFTAETGDNRTVYWYGGFVPFVAIVPLVGMKFNPARVCSGLWIPLFPDVTRMAMSDLMIIFIHRLNTPYAPVGIQFQIYITLP
jgi:hypothetical protein